VRATLTTDVCTAAGRAAVARDAGVAPSAVRMRRAEASTAAPECIFHAGALVLSVSVSGAPQPFAVIDRQDVETSQYWGEKRWTPAPQPVWHEGAEAFWFPGTDQLLTTEGINLVTATLVRWPHVGRRRRRDACAAAARPYLGRIDKALLRGPAP